MGIGLAPGPFACMLCKNKQTLALFTLEGIYLLLRLLTRWRWNIEDRFICSFACYLQRLSRLGFSASFHFLSGLGFLFYCMIPRQDELS